MASISKRVHKDSVTYRVRFRHKGFDQISKTFDEFEEAQEWAIYIEGLCAEDIKFLSTSLYELRSWNARGKHSDE